MRLRSERFPLLGHINRHGSTVGADDWVGLPLCGGSREGGGARGAKRLCLAILPSGRLARRCAGESVLGTRAVIAARAGRA